MIRFLLYGGQLIEFRVDYCLFHCRNKLAVLRVMILQMSIVQGVLLVVQNVFHDIDEVGFSILMTNFFQNCSIFSCLNAR